MNTITRPQPQPQPQQQQQQQQLQQQQQQQSSQPQQQQQFDWSSMIYDVFNKDKPTTTTRPSVVQSNSASSTTSPSFSPLQYPKKESQSPLTTVNEEVWLDDLLSDDLLLSTSRRNSMIELESSNSIFSNYNTNNNSVLESATASFQNTPLIKLENELQDIPSFINLNGTQSQQQQQQQQEDLGELSRNSSIDSMFKDIFSDIEEEITPTSTNSNNNTTSTTVKQKKKRAPRKRLTDHQKQAHNKIEKRYRININAKIAGLQKIIPWVSGEKTAFEIGDEMNDKDLKDNALPRMNKSMILDKLTMYILYLQENEIKMRQENEKLKRELNELKC